MVVGVVKMVLYSGKYIGEFKDFFCVGGGFIIVGINVFEEWGLWGVFMRVVYDVIEWVNEFCSNGIWWKII